MQWEAISFQCVLQLFSVLCIFKVQKAEPPPPLVPSWQLTAVFILQFGNVIFYRAFFGSEITTRVGYNNERLKPLQS